MWSRLRTIVPKVRTSQELLNRLSHQNTLGTNYANRAHKFSTTAQQWRTGTPINTLVLFVPQQEAWVVERMGKFHRVLQPGLNILIPFFDTIRYVQSLKEIAIDVPKQSAITKDNVTLSIDGVLYLRIVDPYKASYGVEDPEFAITQLAQTTMRSELGKISLDSVFQERENLNIQIVASINKASEAWGITCLRYEIRDIKLPSRVQEAMQMQVAAERRKRAAILESEGVREADINVAEGKKKARILSSEAEKQEKINQATGEAQGLVARAEARAKSLELLSVALSSENGPNAASLNVAELYVSAFQQIAKTNNTLILPANAGDVSSMVAQAMTMYQTLSKTTSSPNSSHTPPSSTTSTTSDPAMNQLPFDDSSAEYFSDEGERALTPAEKDK